jgi:hypothetical protein
MNVHSKRPANLVSAIVCATLLQYVILAPLYLLAEPIIGERLLWGRTQRGFVVGPTDAVWAPWGGPIVLSVALVVGGLLISAGVLGRRRWSLVTVVRLPVFEFLFALSLLRIGDETRDTDGVTVWLAGAVVLAGGMCLYKLALRYVLIPRVWHLFR